MSGFGESVFVVEGEEALICHVESEAGDRVAEISDTLTFHVMDATKAAD